MQRFVGEVAVVTGGGNGIGAAAAKRLAAEGATVIVADREEGAAQATVSAIGETGGRADGMVVDVTERESVQRLVDAVMARHGKIDVLCNIAGIAIGESFLEVTDDAWQRTLGVNLTGVYLCSQIVARTMVAQGIAGRIVNMASTNGLVGEANLAHYNASKFGVVGLTMTMAIDLAPHNIRVNSVCPGLIKTRLTASSRSDPAWTNEYLKKIPLNRFGEPEEVAAAVAFLASRDSGFITGHQLVIDGGQLTF